MTARMKSLAPLNRKASQERSEQIERRLKASEKDQNKDRKIKVKIK